MEGLSSIATCKASLSAGAGGKVGSDRSLLQELSGSFHVKIGRLLEVKLQLLSKIILSFIGFSKKYLPEPSPETRCNNIYVG